MRQKFIIHAHQKRLKFLREYWAKNNLNGLPNKWVLIFRSITNLAASTGLLMLYLENQIISMIHFSDLEEWEDEVQGDGKLQQIIHNLPKTSTKPNLMSC